MSSLILLLNFFVSSESEGTATNAFIFITSDSPLCLSSRCRGNFGKLFWQKTHTWRLSHARFLSLVLDGFTKIDLTRCLIFSVLCYILIFILFNWTWFQNVCGFNWKRYLFTYFTVLLLGSMPFATFSFFSLVAFNCELFKDFHVFLRFNWWLQLFTW